MALWKKMKLVSEMEGTSTGFLPFMRGNDFAAGMEQWMAQRKGYPVVMIQEGERGEDVVMEKAEEEAEEEAVQEEVEQMVEDLEEDQ